MVKYEVALGIVTETKMDLKLKWKMSGEKLKLHGLDMGVSVWL